MKCAKFLFMTSAGLLMGCSTPSMTYEPPHVPPLTAAIKERCQGLPDLPDASMGALAAADGETVAAYRECQLRHDAAVDAYERMRETVNERTEP